jgi:phosphate starvation-inducible PhoH-like protein
LDEAQNATIEQIKMVLTRLGHNTKIAITGDPEQSDIRNSGFSYWATLLEDEPYTSVHRMTLEDNQRRTEVSQLLRKYNEQFSTT